MRIKIPNSDFVIEPVPIVFETTKLLEDDGKVPCDLDNLRYDLLTGHILHVDGDGNNSWTVVTHSHKFSNLLAGCNQSLHFDLGQVPMPHDEGEMVDLRGSFPVINKWTAPLASVPLTLETDIEKGNRLCVELLEKHDLSEEGSQLHEDVRDSEPYLFASLVTPHDLFSWDKGSLLMKQLSFSLYIDDFVEKVESLFIYKETRSSFFRMFENFKEIMEGEGGAGEEFYDSLNIPKAKEFGKLTQDYWAEVREKAKGRDLTYLVNEASACFLAFAWECDGWSGTGGEGFHIDSYFAMREKTFGGFLLGEMGCVLYDIGLSPAVRRDPLMSYLSQLLNRYAILANDTLSLAKEIRNEEKSNYFLIRGRGGERVGDVLREVLEVTLPRYVKEIRSCVKKVVKQYGTPENKGQLERWTQMMTMQVDGGVRWELVVKRYFSGVRNVTVHFTD